MTRAHRFHPGWFRVVVVGWAGWAAYGWLMTMGWFHLDGSYDYPTSNWWRDDEFDRFLFSALLVPVLLLASFLWIRSGFRKAAEPK